MEALSKRFSSRIERPQVVCELAGHPRGQFRINSKMYRPEWPVAPLDEDNRLNLAEEIVNIGVEEARRIYAGKQNSPRRIRIEKYECGRTRITMWD